MEFDEAALGAEFPDLLLDSRRVDTTATSYRLCVPASPPGRAFSSAELWIPRGFPDSSKARIRLSTDAILRVPHVEAGGFLCVDGDPGPGVGFSVLDRLRALLYSYYDEFLVPWRLGKLDSHFLKEAQNYWALEIARCSSKDDPVLSVWTIDSAPRHAQVREGVLLLPSRIVIAADAGNAFVRRLIGSVGSRAKQQVRTLIADIPISYGFQPTTWPRDVRSLHSLISARLNVGQQRVFFQPLRRRQPLVHRIAIFRSPQGNFAYLLPGGPPTVIQEGNRARARPSFSRHLPLVVERLDPSWTVGRDQYTEVLARLKANVLVLGAGALGSPVIEHLAKAGIGHITIVDNDTFESANLGRHLLGVDAIDERKSEAVAARVMHRHPSCFISSERNTVERWLLDHDLRNFDLVVDLTGDPDVRWAVDRARRMSPCPLLIGWMEPFVAAAHVCNLPATVFWINDIAKPLDRMSELEAVTWPGEVVRQEPGCSSRFQAYTAVQAGYAIALVAERLIQVIDDNPQTPQVRSWVRGQAFLDQHWTGLQLREWARAATQHDGVMITRDFT